MLQRHEVLAGLRYSAMFVGATASALAIDQLMLQPDTPAEIILEAAAGSPVQLGGIATANCVGAILNIPVCPQNPLEQHATTTTSSTTTTTLAVERPAAVHASRSEPRPTPTSPPPEVASVPESQEPDTNDMDDPVEGEKVLVSDQFRVTCYALQGNTATGRKVDRGAVAVDPRIIPHGTKLWIDGYGWGLAVDTGGDIKQFWIDVWMRTDAECVQWGSKRNVSVYRINNPTPLPKPTAA
ncbi:MAG: 3D domain-containing protein [Patescibacteria group bacterium]